MAIIVTELNHVNLTVPRSVEAAAKRFYSSIMGLKEVPKPASSKGRGGAWYQIGKVQLHLSLEDETDAQLSRRHVCFLVADLEAAKQLRPQVAKSFPTRFRRQDGRAFMFETLPATGSKSLNRRNNPQITQITQIKEKSAGAGWHGQPEPEVYN
jgi:hypothetical protein